MTSMRIATPSPPASWKYLGISTRKKWESPFMTSSFTTKIKMDRAHTTKLARVPHKGDNAFRG